MYSYLITALILLGVFQSVDQWNTLTPEQQQAFTIIITDGHP
ncbi:MAG: hypothetical protein WCR52_04835 [Bacteroidota bacterium]